MQPFVRYQHWVAACLTIGACLSTASAQPLELSQAQLRQLVAQQQIVGAEAIVANTAGAVDGNVMDIRGFLKDGRMTYRVLLQGHDGAVVEIMMDGQSGQRLSHQSDLGQAISAAARQHHTMRTVVRTDSTATANQGRSDTSRSNRDNRGNGGNRGNGKGRG